MNSTTLKVTTFVVLVLFAVSNSLVENALVKAAGSSTTPISTTIRSIAWNQTYTASNVMEIDSVVGTQDGGYLLGGTSRAGSRIVLLGVDSEGNLLWNKTYDGVGNHLSKWLIPTSDGNYAIAGQYQGGFWLAKIDDKGNLQWNQTYIGEGFSWAVSLTQTNDGGYALIGQTGVPVGKTFLSSDEAAGVVWLVRTDSSGNLQWNSTLGQGGAWSVVQNSAGGFAVACTLGSSLPDWLLLTTDSTGNLLLSKTYGSQDDDVCYSVVQTSDGGYALGGWMWLRSNGGGPNQAIVKTDASGNIEWTKYFGSGFTRYMASTIDGGFVLVGTKLTKVDASGNEQWEVALQTNASGTEGYSATETSDGAFLVGGYGGNMNGWLAKITSGTVAPTQEPTASMQEPSVSPTPTVPEFPATAILTLSLSIFLVALLMSRRQHVEKSSRSNLLSDVSLWGGDGAKWL